MSVDVQVTIPLRRYPGPYWGWLLTLAGNVVLASALAGVYLAVDFLGAPMALRAVATIGTGFGVVVALLVGYRRYFAVTACRLLLDENTLTLIRGRGRPTVHDLRALRVRRLAFRGFEEGGGFRHHHIMTLEITGPRLRPLRICAPAVAGGWPASHSYGELPHDPRYQVDPEHWKLLSMALSHRTAE